MVVKGCDFLFPILLCAMILAYYYYGSVSQGLDTLRAGDIFSMIPTNNTINCLQLSGTVLM